MAKLLTEEQYNELIARLERAERCAAIAVKALEEIVALDGTRYDECTGIADGALAEVNDMDGARPHG